MKTNTLMIHGCAYDLTKGYLNGALAARMGQAAESNPNPAGSASRESWGLGFENERAGEHFRFGYDVIAEPGKGTVFPMDEDVSRDPLGCVNTAWSQEQAERYAARTLKMVMAR